MPNIAAALGVRDAEHARRAARAGSCRERPDRVGMYDGITPSPFEAVFLPLSPAEAEHRLVQRSALRYADWLAPQVGWGWVVGDWTVL